MDSQQIELKHETQLIQQIEKFEHGLITQPGYEHEVLRGSSLVVNTMKEMTDGTVNNTIGVSQNIAGVVFAGDECFSIVTAQKEHDDAKSTVLLVRIKSLSGDTRPEIISTITENPIVVGRNSLKDGAATLSGEHFFVQRDEAGNVTITDNDSTNATRVVRYESQPIGGQHTGVRGLKRLIKQRKEKSVGEFVEAPEENPLSMFSIWAPSSERAEAFIDLSGKEDEPHYQEKLDVIDAISKDLRERRFDEWSGKNSIKGAVDNLRGRAVELIAAGDIRTIRDMYDIVVNGSIDGFELPPLLGKWSFGDPFLKASRFIDIYEDSPDLARIIAEQEVSGFHGSRSASLWGVLQHGALLSAAEAKTRNQAVISGERTFSVEGGQKSISFADWRRPDTISNYAGSDGGQPITIDDLENRRQVRMEAYKSAVEQWGETHPFAHNSKTVADDLAKQIEQFTLDPASEEARLTLENFPIAYGVSTRDMAFRETVVDRHEDDSEQKLKIVGRVPSDIPGEFAIEGSELPLKYMPVVAVPRDQIDRVQQLFDNNGQKVAVVDIGLIAGEKLLPIRRRPEYWDYLNRE